ncbi:MAG: hypothetical protein HFH83_06130 [Lachnospiraceae bacterium]|jgi:hypothetical protein|nr:hypothetical protein [Lachnospiraceae bacterium]
MRRIASLAILRCEEALLAERKITWRGLFELSDFLHTDTFLPASVGIDSMVGSLIIKYLFIVRNVYLNLTGYYIIEKQETFQKNYRL